MSDDVLIAAGEWLVVCDARKMLFLSNGGTRERPSFSVEAEAKRSDRRDRELATDRPGRLDAPADGPRSAVEQTSFHDLEEDAFMAEVAERIAAAVNGGKLRSLVVAAPPRALGVLRRHYSEPVRKLLRAEIDSDFANMPVAEIERHFARLASD